jgi:hypothetical protein
MISTFQEAHYHMGSKEDYLLKPSAYYSTKNCSYQLHESLAMCTSCADLSSHVTLTVERIGTNQIFLWALPNGCNISNENSLDSTVPLDLSTRQLQLGVETQYDPVILTAGLSILILTVLMPCIDNVKACDAKACECMLYWCVNKYNSTVIQGSLHEEILATTTTGKEIKVADVSFSQEGQPYYGFPPTQYDLPAPETYGLVHLTNSFYLVGPRANALLTNFTAQTLRGNVFNNNFGLPVSTSAGAARIHSEYSAGDVQGVQTVFETIVASMTSALRSQRY